VRVTLVLLHLCRDCKFFVNLSWPDLARTDPAFLTVIVTVKI
jgi:hypothetical protein